MKLWIKIAILNLLITIGLGLIIALGVRDVVIISLRETLTRQGESIAKNLADRIADTVLLDDIYKAQESIEDVLRTEHDIEYIFVTDKNGRLFVHTFKNGYPPDILQWNPVPLRRAKSLGQELVDSPAAVQLLDTEKGFIRDIGIKVFEGMNPEVHIGIKEERIINTVKGIRNLILSITIIVILIGSLLSFFFSRLITKPLYRLVDFTHALSRGEFGRKIKINSNDEVGELSETFNKLSHELKLYRERVEESYKQMLITEKLTALGRLSAGFAHEIRNPLTSIKTLFHAFRDNPLLLTKEDIEVVLSAVNQMDDLLTSFLRFTRSNEFNLSDIYINSLIKRVMNLSQFQIKNQSINVNLDLKKLPPVKADNAMIQQAILNLVLNAIEAMPDGGILTVSSKMEDGHVCVSVKDTGKGIPENIRDKIFDPFFTTKSDGTGLGLSIVYNIVSIHNGEIIFESDGEGTTFTMRIPVAL